MGTELILDSPAAIRVTSTLSGSPLSAFSMIRILRTDLTFCQAVVSFTCTISRLDDFGGNVRVPVQFDLPFRGTIVGDSPKFDAIFLWSPGGGCPATTAQLGGSTAEIALDGKATILAADTVCPTNNALTLGLIKPAPAEPLAALADALPPFCGAGTYSYDGTNRARVSDRGRLMGRSVSLAPDLAPGTNCIGRFVVAPP